MGQPRWLAVGPRSRYPPWFPRPLKGGSGCVHVPVPGGRGGRLGRAEKAKGTAPRRKSKGRRSPRARRKPRRHSWSRQRPALGLRRRHRSRRRGATSIHGQRGVKQGGAQSPIDLADGLRAPGLPGLRLHLWLDQAKVTNNGHTFQVNVDKGSRSSSTASATTSSSSTSILQANTRSTAAPSRWSCTWCIRPQTSRWRSSAC